MNDHVRADNSEEKESPVAMESATSGGSAVKNEVQTEILPGTQRRVRTSLLTIDASSNAVIDSFPIDEKEIDACKEVAHIWVGTIP